MMSPYELEMLAMQLYRDALNQMPKLQAAKKPRWTEIGLTMRNAYRNAAKELYTEAQQC